VKEHPSLGHKDIHALVSVPLPSGSVKCHGQLHLQYTKEQMDRAAALVRNPPQVDPKLFAEYDFDANN
jgi:hypothetical protein